MNHEMLFPACKESLLLRIEYVIIIIYVAIFLLTWLSESWIPDSYVQVSMKRNIPIQGMFVSLIFLQRKGECGITMLGNPHTNLPFLIISNDKRMFDKRRNDE